MFNKWIVLSAFVLAAPLFADSFETRYFRGNLSPANETPPVTTEAGSAQATITAVARRNDVGAIISGTVYYDIDYNLAQPVVFNNMHIHVGGVGVNGPTRFNAGLGGANAISASGQGNIFIAVPSANANDVAALEGLFTNPSGFYVNLHTVLNSGGMMRDQLQSLATPPSPNVVDGSTVSAASFLLHPAPLAPGSIASLFGKYLNDGPAVGTSSLGADGRLVTSLGGTQVRVGGILAPLFFSFFNQLAFQIPAELAGSSSTTVQVTVGGRVSATRTIFLNSTAPGIFTANANGQGPGVITRRDGSPVTAQAPAVPGEVVVVYVTGLGATTPPLATGVQAGSSNIVATPTVTIDGAQATVLFAGRTPTLVGSDQINVQIPVGTRVANDIVVRVTAGASLSNEVTLAVESNPFGN
jgi:uncharacterized protein (TIGR03437 family)